MIWRVEYPMSGTLVRAAETVRTSQRRMEERFQHIFAKEAQVKAIFEESRKLTDEVIRQNADFRLYNETYRRLQERVVELTNRIAEPTDKLLKKK